eukprot:sb/3476201/
MVTRILGGIRFITCKWGLGVSVLYHVMPLPNNTSVRTINVEIFDEKSLTDDLRVAFAKINVPERVFQGHTVDEWYPLSGKLGTEAEGSINLIISYTVTTVNYLASEVYFLSSLKSPYGW